MKILLYGSQEHTDPRGTPIYKPYRYVSHHRVGFLCRFGLKTGIDFAHIGLESGAFQFQMSKKERDICRFEWKLRNLFCCCSNLSNDDIIILRCQVWKRVWILQARSESRWEKWYHLVWNRVRIWRTRQHTSTKDSQEYPLPHRIHIGSQCRLHKFRKANP